MFDKLMKNAKDKNQWEKEKKERNGKIKYSTALIYGIKGKTKLGIISFQQRRKNISAEIRIK